MADKFTNKFPNTPKGLLSVESDVVAYDPLKTDRMYNLDPLSPEASNRVAGYYDEYGLALLPEEAVALNQQKEDYQNRSSSLAETLQAARPKFEQELAKSDQAAAEQLAAFKPPTVSLSNPIVPVKVTLVGKKGAPVQVGSDGSIKGIDRGHYPADNRPTYSPASYTIGSSVLEALQKTGYYITSDGTGGFVIDISKSKTGGSKTAAARRLIAALPGAEQQTRDIENQQKQMLAEKKAQADAQYQQELATAKQEIAQARQSSIDSFEQEYDQGMQVYYNIGKQWGDTLAELTNKQTRARQSASDAVQNLNQSGLLNYTTTVK